MDITPCEKLFFTYTARLTFLVLSIAMYEVSTQVPSFQGIKYFLPLIVDKSRYIHG